MAAKARNKVEVHHELTHPSEEITQITSQAMGIVTTGQWRLCEARLQAEAKRQAVQWVDGPDKTGSNGVGDKDLGVQPGEDESVGKREAPQLDVQELELEQQPVSQERLQTRNTGGTAGARRRGTGGAAGSRGVDTRGAAESRGGDTGGATGSRSGDTKNATGSRGKDTGGTIGSRGTDTGGTVGSRRGDTGGATGSRVGDTGSAIGSQGGDTGGTIGS